MGYTRESLELAVKGIVDSLGGVRHLFSHHRLHRDGQDLETFEAEWPALPLESRVGKLACLIGPSRIGDCGLITHTYLDLCRTNPCTSRQNWIGTVLSELRSTEPRMHFQTTSQRSL